MNTDVPGNRDGLTEQQRLFCAEYLIDFNASRAAREAGYAPSTAASYIYKLLNTSEIQAELRRLIDERARRTLLTADRVILELAAVAYSNHDHYRVDEGGNVVLSEDADPLAHRAIASVKRKTRSLGRGEDRIEESEVEIRLWDKVAALKLLAMHLGLLDKRVTVAGDPEKPLRVEGTVAHRAELPADDTIAECLRRLGLPAPGDAPAAGGG